MREFEVLREVGVGKDGSITEKEGNNNEQRGEGTPNKVRGKKIE